MAIWNLSHWVVRTGENDAGHHTCLTQEVHHSLLYGGKLVPSKIATSDSGLIGDYRNSIRARSAAEKISAIPSISSTPSGSLR